MSLALLLGSFEFIYIEDSVVSLAGFNLMFI